MSLPHNLRAPVDIMRPEPVGISDRSGKMYFLRDMVWQFQWVGNSLKNLRILVGKDEVDEPSEFLRPVIIGPEPAPLPDARPTHYETQNQGGTPPPTIAEILGE